MIFHGIPVLFGNFILHGRYAVQIRRFVVQSPTGDFAPRFLPRKNSVHRTGIWQRKIIMKFSAWTERRRTPTSSRRTANSSSSTIPIFIRATRPPRQNSKRSMKRTKCFPTRRNAPPTIMNSIIRARVRAAAFRAADSPAAGSAASAGSEIFSTIFSAGSAAVRPRAIRRARISPAKSL